MDNQAKASGLAVASLVTGILSVVSFIGGMPLGIASIVCGSIDLARIKDGSSGMKGKGMDIAGIILGIAGIILTIVLLILGVFLFFQRFGIQSINSWL